MQYTESTLQLLQRFRIPVDEVAARGLREFPEATRLKLAEVGADGRRHLLEPRTAAAWIDMKQVAAAKGVTLYIVSAFRSFERQAEIIQRKREAGRQLNEIFSLSAPPGFSEHHSGRALDIGTLDCKPLSLEFSDSAAYEWLRERAGKFGFNLSYPAGNSFGYEYEPWHWCYRGRGWE